MGIINHGMAIVEDLVDLLERGDAIDLGAGGDPLNSAEEEETPSFVDLVE